ncbi:MAG: SRPBCC family protein [Sphingomicrobium sp.]
MGLSASQSSTQNGTLVERKSDRDLVVTRMFDAPAHIVFEAWTKPELFMRWWAPKSTGVPVLSCEMDVRTGGRYRVEFGQDASNSWAFFGKYLEVSPGSRLVWTNDEGEDGAVTTVTFEETGGKTLLTFHELYPSKEALDESFIGMEGGMPEQLDQLDDLLASLGAGVGKR